MCAPAFFQAVGAAYQGYATQEAAKAQSRQAGRNAVLTDTQADDALSRADVGGIRGEGRALSARVVAAAAANNISTTTGSVKAFEVANAENSELDAARLKADAAREAWGYRNEARQYRAEAYNTKRAGVLGSFGSTVGSFGSIGGS